MTQECKRVCVVNVDDALKDWFFLHLLIRLLVLAFLVLDGPESRHVDLLRTELPAEENCFALVF